jgi:hypothetical protein
MTARRKVLAALIARSSFAALASPPQITGIAGIIEPMDG